jgi:predicted ATPase/Tfp pilus assembly protein PilF
LFVGADRRLYEAKRHGRDRVTADDPLAPVQMTFEAGSRVLGRELPLATLRQFFEHLPDRQHGALAISGPFGSGKTWFLAEAVKMARLRGYAAWSLNARPALRTRVYGAVTEAKPLASSLPPPAAGEKVFIRAVQSYLSEEGKAGLILAVDNLAELDRDTFELLRRLLFASEINVAALIYTIDPASAYHAAPLEAPLEVQVELGPLSTLGVRLWLRSVLRWEAPESFCQWLHRETDGLPGNLHSGLNYLIQQQVVQPLKAGWSLSAAYERIQLRHELTRLLRLPSHNLPAAVGGFVGRDDELHLLKQLLATEPLVTVAGSGGIGKTRLALQAAAEMLERFRDGVFVVSLASVANIDVMISTTAQVLGLAFVGQEDGREQLLNHLASKEMLLILDDFQYSLNAAELLAHMRQRLPKVRLLITARDRLALPGEMTVELRGLPIPPEASEALRGGALPPNFYSAEQLFLLAARRAVPDFVLTDEDRLHVRRICQLVEGLPLGIELAAVWTPLFSCRDIALQIERNVDFLATSRVDVPERQRSTRAVLDYFWSLLAEDERRRVRGLSVFRGGFEREAAHRVADASLFFLSALVDKAFLRRGPSGRYEMHELLRQYADLKLSELHDEQLAAGDRHCTYYAEFLQRSQALVKGGEQAAALAAVNVEIANVRAAWLWAVTRGLAVEIRGSMLSLALFYDIQNWYQEGAEIFIRARQAWEAGAGHPAVLAAQPDATLAQLLTGQGIFWHRLGLNGQSHESLDTSLDILSSLPAGDCQSERALTQYFLGLVKLDLGEYDAARSLLRQSLKLRREVNDSHGVALALNELAGVAYHLGDYTEAGHLYQESLQLRRAIGDQYGVLRSLSHAGELALDLGDYSQAQALLDEGAQLSRVLGKRLGSADSLRHLGRLDEVRGDAAAARQHYRDSLAFNQDSGSPKQIAHDLLALANLALHDGDYLEAQRLNAESLALSRRTGYRRGIALAQLGLGDVALSSQGTPDGLAYACYEDAIQTALTIHALPCVLAALVGIAALWDTVGRRAQAVGLLMFALYHPACNQRTRDRATRLLSRLETDLPAAQVAQAEERGRHRPLDEAVSEALAAGAAEPDHASQTEPDPK